MVKCKLCNYEAKGYKVLGKHYDEVHPNDRPKRYTPKAKPIVLEGSVQAKIHQGETLIKEALREVDAERNILSNKLLELDNLAARYNKMLNPHSK